MNRRGFFKSVVGGACGVVAGPTVGGADVGVAGHLNEIQVSPTECQSIAKVSMYVHFDNWDKNVPGCGSSVKITKVQ